MTQLLQEAFKALKLVEEWPVSLQDSTARRVLNALQVDRPNEAEAESNGEAPFVSAYDVSKHLAGSIKGGPSDLSTNPKYMEGFGKSSLE